jgi:hypothetical protein
LCDANSLQSSQFIEATAECTISKGNIDEFSPKEAPLMHTELLSVPLNISKQKAVNYQAHAGALALTHDSVSDQNSSIGFEKISFFQVLVFSYPASILVSYSMVNTVQNLFTVALFTNFSIDKMAEAVHNVQIDKLVRQVELGEPPPWNGF